MARGVELDKEKIAERAAQERAEAEVKAHEEALEERRATEERERLEARNTLAETVPAREKLRLVRRQMILRGADATTIPVVAGDGVHEGSSAYVQILEELNSGALETTARGLIKDLEREEETE